MKNTIDLLDKALLASKNLGEAIDLWGKSCEDTFLRLISERQVEIDKWKLERIK